MMDSKEVIVQNVQNATTLMEDYVFSTPLAIFAILENLEKLVHLYAIQNVFMEFALMESVNVKLDGEEMDVQLQYVIQFVKMKEIVHSQESAHVLMDGLEIVVKHQFVIQYVLMELAQHQMFALVVPNGMEINVLSQFVLPA